MASGEHDGHRKRLTEKSNRIGFAMLEDHEQLEEILFAVIPRGDTNALAHRLLQQCGTLYDVLTADVEELAKVPGVGSRVAQFLHDLYSLLGSLERCQLRKTAKEYPSVCELEERGSYAKSLFYGTLTETFYLISVNRRLQAYRFDKIAQGNDEEVPVYIREVVKLALKNQAKHVILTHNHPSGQLQPSHADIQTTRKLKAALETVEISLLDHIVVGSGEFISLKQLQLI